MKNGRFRGVVIILLKRVFHDWYLKNNILWLLLVSPNECIRILTILLGLSPQSEDNHY